MPRYTDVVTVDGAANANTAMLRQGNGFVHDQISRGNANAVVTIKESGNGGFFDDTNIGVGVDFASGDAFVVKV